MNYCHLNPRSLTDWKAYVTLCVLLLSSFVIRHSSFATDAPTLIPFQARLTNQAGVAYANGQYTITFNIYGVTVGGSTSWTERHEKVGVVNGMVNVFLGSIQAITSVDFSATRYLGITVDADDNAATADPEMVPRQMILPAFFAKNSQKLMGYDWTPLTAGGTNNLQTDFLKGSKIEAGSITSVQIGNGQIIAANIGNAQVTGAKLAPGAADGAISDESITSQKIKDGEVKTTDILNAAITGTKIANGALSEEHFTQDAVPAWLLKRDLAILSDTKAQGTSGGASGNNTWFQRTLNTVDYASMPTGSGISLSANSVTLAPGTYFIRASAPCYAGTSHQTAIRDVTGNPPSPVVVLWGTSEYTYTPSLSSIVVSRSSIEGAIVVSGGSRVYQLWHYIEQFSTQGLGDPVGQGPEKYSTMVIERIK